MLDPGTETIISALVSPAVMIAVMGYISNRYFTKQEETTKAMADGLTNLSKTLTDLQLKLAIAESRSELVEEVRRDLKELRDEQTKIRSSVEAAWRVLDKPRLS